MFRVLFAASQLDNAVSACVNHGGRLAEVKNAFVSGQMVDISVARQEDIWIGAIDQGGSWVWVTSQEGVTWTDWGEGEPNSELPNNCGRIRYWVNGWGDTRCHREYSYFCEFF